MLILMHFVEWSIVAAFCVASIALIWASEHCRDMQDREDRRNQTRR